MKIRLLVLIIIVQIAMISILYAQAKVKTLVKGDMIPINMILGKMINYKSKTAKFSDFKGKLLILDFWATTCSPCVRGLYRMDSLQKQFKSKVAILPVTFDKDQTVKNYFKKHHINLPSIVGDTFLCKIFPQLSLDMHIWIDGKGKVIITTGGDEVNQQAISSYLNTGKLNVKERIDWNFDMLLLDKNNTSSDGFISYSLFRKTKGGGGISIDRFESVSSAYKSISIRGLSFIYIYNTVFSMNRNNYVGGKYSSPVPNPNWFVFETNDKSFSPLNYWNERDSPKDSIMLWMAGNRYDYDFKVPFPGIKSDSIFYRKYLLEDLNRISSYYAKIEKRKIKSWIIIRKSDSASFLAKSSESTNISPYIFHDSFTLDRLEKVQNIPFNHFMQWLVNTYFMMPPIFNETGYNEEKINIKDLKLDVEDNNANKKPLNLEEWRAAFQRNGLDIKVEDREVEVMVFKKKETPTK